jgi:hypothetical protein
MAQLSNLVIGNSDRVQSAYLVLQASGSGTGGFSDGIHLRWDFLRTLGDNHLPKGDLVAPDEGNLTDAGFNKPNDYVQVFRVPYTKKYKASVQFGEDIPDTIVEFGSTREWHFNKVISGIDFQDVSTTVIVRFDDIYLYDQIRATHIPVLGPLDFIKLYTGILEVEAQGKLSFAATIRVKQDAPANGVTRVETVSVQDNQTADEETYLSVRKTFNFNSASLQPPPPDKPIVDDTAFLQMQCFDEYTLMAENMRYVRFDCINQYPVIVALETYSDFIAGASGQDQPWESVGADNGRYSLTTDQDTAFNRLDNATLNIDGHWGRFYPSDATAPLGGPNAFKVNTANYQHKWNRPDGISNGITTYLNLSQDPGNPQGIQEFKNNATLLDSSTYSFNYLTFLKYIALDYHIARMMGFGVIDTDGLTGTRGNKKYIYLSVYGTQASLEGETAAAVNHYYMTLPTGKLDEKLPAVPVMKDLTYGLVYDKGTEVPIQLTDANGYAKYDAVRYINIAVNQDIQPMSLPAFFSVITDFRFVFESEAVFYGLEYSGEQSPGVWEDHYRVPKLSVDDEYLDANGNNEIVPLIHAEQTEVIFTHNEKEQGVHRYATYAINWFSRYSDLSTAKPTDNTVFPHRCTLIPPANFAVQNIQEEETLIFTTSVEQSKLQALTGDKTLVRVTYEINDAHNAMYQIGNKVQFFFKQSPPQNIGGLISTVTTLSGQQADVKTAPLVLTSQGQVNGQYSMIDPVISTGDIAKFTGSLLSTPDRKFRIAQVYQDTGNNNRVGFVVDQINENSAMEPEGDNVIVPHQNFFSPAANVKFFAAQNMTAETSWDRTLSKEIDTINFSESKITASGTNSGVFTPLSLHLNVANTDIYVRETIASAAGTSDNISFDKKAAGISVDQGSNTIVVAGDLSKALAAGTQITIEQARIPGGGNTANGTYIVTDVSVVDTKTTIHVNSFIPDAPERFIVSFKKVVPVVGVDQGAGIIRVKGDVTQELLLTHTEVGYLEDGDTFLVHVGGIFELASITALPDVQLLTDNTGKPILDADGNEQNEDIPGSLSGIYTVVFNSYNLVDHPDADVEWYNGKIRIPVADSSSDEIKTLEVIRINRAPSLPDQLGAILSPLTLMVFDPDFGSSNSSALISNPLQSRTDVRVNFHPGYRVYLTAEAAGAQSAFDQSTIMPGAGTKEKQTFLGTRYIDTYNNCASPITQPAVMQARKIVPPLPPMEPRGALFATRPDFYGKSTYTFDVSIDQTDPTRDPFAFIFFRTNTSNVLSTLYTPETMDAVEELIANLSDSDKPFLNSIWYDLMNLNLDGTRFKQYPGGFRFPNPDNPLYSIPSNEPQRVKTSADYPFVTAPDPGTIHDLVKQAIDGSFNPLTPQPVTYTYMLTGEQTRNTKAVIKDSNGEYLVPGDPAFDPCPMVVKLPYSPKAVRFTDYTLDGASNELYFYYGQEMNDQLQTSDRSPIAGPIRLVNSIAAEPPVIRKITTQLANPIQGIPTAVKIEVDSYLETEHIKKLRIYRAYKNLDAQSVRSMKVAKEVDYSNAILELTDDFSDEPFAPYGEFLYYRIVGLREILNERNETEYIPSQPSKLLLSNIVDVINPPAPLLSYTRDEVSTPVRMYTNVVLSWSKTVHNGTYYVYQMTSSGNWTKLADVKSNDETVSYAVAASLVKTDEDGNELFYRFRVDVVNSSGLLNLETKELTL